MKYILAFTVDDKRSPVFLELDVYARHEDWETIIRKIRDGLVAQGIGVTIETEHRVQETFT
jgi:hypothetical protein